MNEIQNILTVLPTNINKKISEYLSYEEVQEIRIRSDSNIFVLTSDKEIVINYKVSNNIIKSIVQRMSSYSLYAFEEELKQGFLTIKGGHRIGVAGEWVNDHGKIKTIKNISSINIRFAREIQGCSKDVLPEIVEHGEVLNTIIISPPKCGKTTILRDLCRNISNGNKNLNLAGKKVSVIDERSEIAACYLGVPQMNVGIRTDVFDNCLKSEGLLMAVRSMSPDVVICDEIGTYNDCEALLNVFNCGVSIIATLHGKDLKDLENREGLRRLIDNDVLDRVIVLSNRKGVGTLEKVYDLRRE